MIYNLKKKKKKKKWVQCFFTIGIWNLWLVVESVKSKKKKKKEWVQCFFTIGIWNQWLVVESVKSITSFYCPAVPELYGSLICAFWLLTWKFCLLDDVLLVDSVLCMIADHDLVFGRYRNKEPHSSAWCLGVTAIKNHTPPVFSCVVWLLSGTKTSFSFPRHTCVAR